MAGRKSETAAAEMKISVLSKCSNTVSSISRASVTFINLLPKGNRRSTVEIKVTTAPASTAAWASA
ncbi:hypothetical protein ATX30_04670 [Oenococcus oeni]|nr:hypothetical protein ATX30_04670 [Oenococcus oeni]